MITPQAGDLWKLTYIKESSPSQSGPDDWEPSPNLITNGSYSATTQSRCWYIYKREYDGKLMSITDDEDKMLLEHGIEDGKNGWELVYRPQNKHLLPTEDKAAQLAAPSINLFHPLPHLPHKLSLV
jgi:hypothetical protein